MGRNRKLKAKKKKQEEVIGDPLLAARETYEISEHWLALEVMRAFGAYSKAMLEGEYCEGGMEWMFQYLEEAFRLMGLDEMAVLVRKDMMECFRAWEAYVDRKAEEEELLYGD